MKHFCWSVGVKLQTCVSSLEDWVSSVGLEAHYLKVSERLLSLVDLLATSRHTLLRVSCLSVCLSVFLTARPSGRLSVSLYV